MRGWGLPFRERSLWPPGGAGRRASRRPYSTCPAGGEAARKQSPRSPSAHLCPWPRSRAGFWCRCHGVDAEVSPGWFVLGALSRVRQGTQLSRPGRCRKHPGEHRAWAVPGAEHIGEGRGERGGGGACGSGDAGTWRPWKAVPPGWDSSCSPALEDRVEKGTDPGKQQGQGQLSLLAVWAVTSRLEEGAWRPCCYISGVRQALGRLGPGRKPRGVQWQHFSF